MDLDSQPKVSWKQMLLEKGVSNQEKGSRSSKVECTESFQFLEGDVIKDYQWYSDNRVFGLYTTNFDRGYGSNSGFEAIRLPGLPGFMYKRRILKEVGGLVGKVVKLDFHIDSKTRGRFAKKTIFVYLYKPLASYVLVNGELQRGFLECSGATATVDSCFCAIDEPNTDFARASPPGECTCVP
ncbi:hypothetical protein Goklo_024431, partial [Gossypium klotzschianum]|nr:hypothetical protein [Gossypium klotzschianum]